MWSTMSPRPSMPCLRLSRIDRRACRAAFETRFGAATMSRNYLDVYDRLIAAHEPV